MLEAFLKAQAEATDYLHDHPVAAAEKVAKATGLPAEVVYLYNGAHGIATFTRRSSRSWSPPSRRTSRS
ncbi:ABC-type nitrate/sulfonate/bicarbonate transport system substrate-binding protein [Streptomyces phaeochromogenes]|nr:ABC-type nitrate/sulfonate/bicarbonate transport system substrate-binding protein [Streptomyces phaeochromogenes]